MSTTASAEPAHPRRFALVVPVKPSAVAKSRLAPLGDRLRRELVAAFAADTLVAVLATPEVAAVLVVTDDVALARGFADLGVASVPDGHTGDLNETLRQGAAELLRRRPGSVPVALCADLPSMRSDELSEVLRSCPEDAAAFVPDAAGTGTTLYAAPDLARFAPRFGATSRDAHVAAGARELLLPVGSSVRRDVDTPADLAAARSLGLGPRTTWVLTRHATDDPEDPAPRG